MLFYRVEVKTTSLSEVSDRREQIDRAAAIRLKIEELFDKSKHLCHIAVASIDDKKQKLTLCAALKSGILSEKAVASFLNTVDLPYKQASTSPETDAQGGSLEIQEITLDAYSNLLYTSSRNNFIADEDDVFEKLCLDELNPRRYRSTYYSETLVCDGETKTELLNKSAELLCCASLSEEIERIYQSRKGKKSPVGHPVHYYLQSDHKESCNKTLQILLTALFQNGRIAGRRYCEVNLNGLENFPEKKLNALYESCSGETIVIPIYQDVPNESRYADTRMSSIAVICALMNKYRNSVLTVFCLPRENKIKDAITRQSAVCRWKAES